MANRLKEEAHWEEAETAKHGITLPKYPPASPTPPAKESPMTPKEETPEGLKQKRPRLLWTSPRTCSVDCFNDALRAGGSAAVNCLNIFIGFASNGWTGRRPAAFLAPN